MSKAKRWIIGYKGKSKPDEQALVRLGLRIVGHHAHEDGGMVLAESAGALADDALDKIRKVPGVAHVEEDETIRLNPPAE